MRQELINQIRGAILAFEYEPGTRLVERALCEDYGVSRTVVRESLRQLEAEGLVTMVPNRGPIVTVLDKEDAAALFEVRTELEALAAKLFALHATTEEQDQLKVSVDEVAEAFKVDNLKKSLVAKDNFYQALLAGAHNAVVSDLLVGLHARVQLLRGVSLRAEGRKPKSLKEIRRICQLAVAGEADAAAEAARHHVRQAAAVVFAAMDDQTSDTNE